jgi:hypothetical protein
LYCRIAAEQRSPRGDLAFPAFLTRPRFSRPRVRHAALEHYGADRRAIVAQPASTDIMSQRPTTFGQLLRRLSSPNPGIVQNQGPLIASAKEIAEASQGDDACLWVILHSITDSDVRLIHSRPLSAREIAVQIPVPSGEVLSVMLTTADSEKKGDLYESTGQFLQ